VIEPNRYHVLPFCWYCI